MAVDIFLKIAGVDGESEDSKHKNEIQVLSWSWGLSNTASASVGAGAGSGKVNVQDLTVTKYVDKSTPKLLLASCNGSHFDDALLTVRKAGGQNPVEYLKIKLQKVFVSSVSTGGHGSDDRVMETVSFNFGKVNVDYTPQTDKGAAGTAVTMGWDIPGNTKV
jgi:type VI secretion system secreted protein Hcp